MLNDAQIEQLKDLARRGMAYIEIARQFGISKPTLYNYIGPRTIYQPKPAEETDETRSAPDTDESAD